MGTCSTTVQQSPQTLAVQGKRLRLYLNLQTERQVKECCSQEKLLLKEFKKDRVNRTKCTQETMLNQLVLGINKIQTYEILKSQCNKIVDYSHYINDPVKRQEVLFPVFRFILYSESIVRNSQVSQQCYALKKRYPKLFQAEETEITSEIMRHHKKTDTPSFEMKNDYINKLCSQQNVDISQINSIGYQFKYEN